VTGRLNLIAAVLALACFVGTIANATKPGDRYQISPSNLTVPDPKLPDDIDPQFVDRPVGMVPLVPDGFSISVFASASQLTHARWLAVAPNGDVFLSEQGPGKITLLRDANGDGRAELATTFATGFTLPHGMAFRDGALYVADVRGIWRIPYREGDTVAKAKPVKVTAASDLRTKGWHLAREIAFDSKGALYLAIGAREDVLDDDPPPDASVQLVASDGTMTTFATGLRNVSALAFYPGTDDLWGTVNERDKLGAQLPPDFLARIGRGDFFGWPYAYVGTHPDPKFGPKRPDLVAKSKTPEVLFEAHSAPLGLAFYSSPQFPAEYKGDAFVALHGSGPYDKPDGYKVVRVRFADGKPTGAYEDFVTGFADEGKPGKKGVLAPRVWGTPTGLAIAKDGSLLIADEKGKVVWRVSYNKR
jgi:glucose/arabinose dehydrogenase